jgi:hypothetical protein
MVQTVLDTLLGKGNRYYAEAAGDAQWQLAANAALAISSDAANHALFHPVAVNELLDEFGNGFR